MRSRITSTSWLTPVLKTQCVKYGWENCYCFPHLCDRRYRSMMRLHSCRWNHYACLGTGPGSDTGARSCCSGLGIRGGRQVWSSLAPPDPASSRSTSVTGCSPGSPSASTQFLLKNTTNRLDIFRTTSYFIWGDIMEIGLFSDGLPLSTTRMVQAVLNNKMMKRTLWVEQTQKAKAGFCWTLHFCLSEFNPGIRAYSKQMISVLFSLLIKAQPSVILTASNSQPHCALYVNCCRENNHFQMLLLQHYVWWAVHFTCKFNQSAPPSYYSFQS